MINFLFRKKRIRYINKCVKRNDFFVVCIPPVIKDGQARNSEERHNHHLPDPVDWIRNFALCRTSECQQEQPGW